MSDAVRSVQRALLIMRVMNGNESWTLQRLAQKTGMPKATVHRLLGTLEEEGYVHTFPRIPGLYRLTRQTQELSAGLTDFTVFADLAEPLIIEATRALSWPVSFAMPEPPFMRVVSCGMPYAPARSAKPTSVEKRHWMFSSAVGRAYLSRCAADEVTAICDSAVSFCTSSGLALPIPKESEILQDSIEVRANGYAIRFASRSDLNSAIAVPVHSSEAVLGALACSTFPRCLTQSFINATLSALPDVAREIFEACNGSGGHTPHRALPAEAPRNASK